MLKMNRRRQVSGMLTIGVELNLERQASEVIPYWEGHWEVERQDVIPYRCSWALGGYSVSSLDDRGSVSQSRVTTLHLGSETVTDKPYRDLQSLPVLTHRWKDFSMNFITGLPISTDWKRESYDSILVIVDWLTIMMHYELVKVTIDAPRLAEVILDMVVWHHDLLNLIVSDRGLLFTSKFWSSLCYFLSIERGLLTAFYP